jgi:hypothetical protein
MAEICGSRRRDLNLAPDRHAVSLTSGDTDRNGLPDEDTESLPAGNPIDAHYPHDVWGRLRCVRDELDW